MHARITSILGLVLLLPSCGGLTEVLDGDVPDARVGDGGLGGRDASLDDAGLDDAGTIIDAGTPADAAREDTGGGSGDASTADTGASDGGPADAWIDDASLPHGDPPIQVASRQAILLVRADGTAWARGRHDKAQLGDGSVECYCMDLLTPAVRITGLTNVVDVQSLIITSFALLADGTVWVWGDGSSPDIGEGALFGDATGGIRRVPGRIPGLTDIRQLVARTTPVYAIDGDGTVWAWGTPIAGGLGSSSDGRRPAPVEGLAHVTTMDGVNAHALAIRDDGTVFTWGNNAFGQAGDGTITPGLLLAGPSGVVPGLTEVVSVATYGNSNFAVRSDGTVWAWGDNASSQLGFPPSAPLERVTSPRQIPGLAGVTRIVAGDFQVIALTREGTVWTWGPSVAETPVQVQGLRGITEIRAGGGAVSFAWQGPDILWGWGSGTFDLGSSVMPATPLTPVLSDAFFR